MSIKTEQIKKPKEQFDLFKSAEGGQFESQFVKEKSIAKRVKYISIGRENEPWFCDLTTFWEQ